jgi:hypothetical protein
VTKEIREVYKEQYEWETIYARTKKEAKDKEVENRIPLGGQRHKKAPVPKAKKKSENEKEKECKPPNNCPACKGKHRAHDPSKGCTHEVKDEEETEKKFIRPSVRPGRQAPVLGPDARPKAKDLWDLNKDEVDDSPFKNETVPAEVEPLDPEHVKKELDEEKKEPLGNLEANPEIPFAWRSCIRHVHQQMGHPSNDALARQFARGGAPADLIRAVKTWKCASCDSRRSLKTRRKVAIPHARAPNEGVAIDVFYIKDERKHVEDKREGMVSYSVHCYTCCATMFTQAIVVEGDATAETNRDGFEDVWIGHYGPPRFVITDGGPENVGHVFEDFLTFWDVFHHVCVPDAPWQNGTAERNGAVLKEMILKCMQETCSSVKRIARTCCNAKNELVRSVGHAPCEWFHGRMPRPVYEPTDGEAPLASISLAESDEIYSERQAGIRTDEGPEVYVDRVVAQVPPHSGTVLPWGSGFLLAACQGWKTRTHAQERTMVGSCSGGCRPRQCHLVQSRAALGKSLPGRIASLSPWRGDSLGGMSALDARCFAGIEVR